MSEQIMFEMYVNNFRYIDIAKRIGSTASAVAGRIDRAVLKGIIERRPNIVKKKSVERNGKGIVMATLSKLNGKLYEPKWNYEPLGAGVKLVELLPNQCRFPCAGDVYCGAATHNNGSKFVDYCDTHYKVVFTGKGARL